MVPAPIDRTGDEPSACTIRVRMRATRECESAVPTQPSAKIGRDRRYIGLRPSVKAKYVSEEHRNQGRREGAPRRPTNAGVRCPEEGKDADEENKDGDSDVDDGGRCVEIFDDLRNRGKKRGGREGCGRQRQRPSSAFLAQSRSGKV